MKKRIERASFWVTVASTVVAVAAAGAAIYSAYEARETRIEDERPSVMADHLPDQKVGASSPFLRIQVQNKGKSTAKNIRVSCRNVFEIPASPAQWNPETAPSTETYRYFQPTKWVRLSCANPDGGNPPANAKAVELGIITYQDLDDREYVTPFCVTFEIPSNNAPLDVYECKGDRNLPKLE
jgi:hypothetical protein